MSTKQTQDSRQRWLTIRSPIYLSIIVTATVLLIRKYDLINYYLTQPTSPVLGTDGRIFTDFEFDPRERFNVDDTLKYSWIIAIIFIIAMSVLLGI